MEIKVLDKKQIKKLIRRKPIDGTFNVFEEENGILKVYKDPMFELGKYQTVIFPGTLVDVDQIHWLESKQSEVKGSDLPNGIVFFEKLPIGVTYPRYFKGYKNFYHLHEESVERIIRNFRTAIDKNIELIRVGILNVDFTMHNIIYKDDDVQLIDLDGKYIGSDFSLVRVYSYFVYGMMNEIYEKIKTIYGEKESLIIIRDLTKMIESYRPEDMTLEYPHIVLDEVEKSQVLKLK